MLEAASASSGAVSAEALEYAIRGQVDARFADLNLSALAGGRRIQEEEGRGDREIKGKSIHP